MLLFISWSGQLTGETLGRLLARAVETAAILVLLFGLLAAGFGYLRERGRESHEAYQNFRSSLGRSILTGLEILIVADLIATVSAEPSFQSLATLGLIILIRTFVSLTLEIELHGRLPWKRADPGT